MEQCKWYDVSCFAQWVRDELHAFSLWLYESVIMGFASLMDAIPVPDFFAQMGSFQMPPGLSFFLDAFEITFGLQVVVSAYVARFILRRIPGIG